MDSSTQYGSGNDMMDWLFDDARKSGDADVVDYTYYGMSMGSMVLVFHSKERADFHTVSVRHILVDDEAKANDILAQFNAGDRSEDSFAALAQANSTDNADDGGLYTGVYPGQMVETFNDWCFDASRQTGDTGIVQTDYGYHVMYFVGRSNFAYWQELVASSLSSDRISAITENAQTELLSGMKYIET
jgi:parvulin-like peptidyl-prolyl isomerase